MPLGPRLAKARKKFEATGTAVVAYSSLYGCTERGDLRAHCARCRRGGVPPPSGGLVRRYASTYIYTRNKISMRCCHGRATCRAFDFRRPLWRFMADGGGIIIVRSGTSENEYFRKRPQREVSKAVEEGGTKALAREPGSNTHRHMHVINVASLLKGSGRPKGAICVCQRWRWVVVNA